MREADFKPVPGSVQRQTDEPFGLFEFDPAERLDLDLLDRVLVAAKDEADVVEGVCLPESAVREDEIEAIEAVLRSHGVSVFLAGVREFPTTPPRLAGNWVHAGFNPNVQGPGEDSGDTGEPWLHLRQNKHHRWSLDETQIFQYHLGGALHPLLRWWEAMHVPRRVVQFVEIRDATVVFMVCEDLAQNDDVADIVRSVGPTGLFTPLLDGPQLSARWAARYASTLADDPGSAVFTLTSYGMVQRSRPHGREASTVVAMWKDPTNGAREIPLESGAHGVLLTTCVDRTNRRTIDGRVPEPGGTHFFDVSVSQIRAADTGSSHRPVPTTHATATVDADDLTILNSWAQALAEAMAHAPGHTTAVLAAAQAGADWRAAVGIAEPSEQLSQALLSLAAIVASAAQERPDLPLPALIATIAAGVDADPAGHLPRRALQYALESRLARQLRTGVPA